MKKLIKRLFLLIICVALIFLGIRFGPALYHRLFNGGNAQWISERFSETLKEKKELLVYETEITGQETVSTDAWLLPNVQKVMIPYTFEMSFSVDLSNAQVTADERTIEIRIPSPKAGYQKLTVNEAEVKKEDWLYPLTPERYAEIKTTLENKLFEEGKENPTYLTNAWNSTVKSLGDLFKAVAESRGDGNDYQIDVVKDDTVGVAQATQPATTPEQQE